MSLESSSELLKLGNVVLLDISDSNARGGLLVDEETKTSLALDNAERNVELTAESREEDDEFNGVNIMSNDNELSLAGLNEVSNVVKTLLDEAGLGGLGLSNLVTSSLLSSELLETVSLSNTGLRAVSSKETEESSS